MSVIREGREGGRLVIKVVEGGARCLWVRDEERKGDCAVTLATLARISEAMFSCANMLLVSDYYIFK